jgi:hypothetical protein
MPESKQATELANPTPIPVADPRAIIVALQQRQIASAQLQAAEAIVQNAVLQAALEAGVDPKLYEINLFQNAQGDWEFRAKTARIQ